MQCWRSSYNISQPHLHVALHTHLMARERAERAAHDAHVTV